MDETAFLAASATRTTSFVTGIVDLTRRDRPARLFDVVAGRSASGLVSWIASASRPGGPRSPTAALDPFRGYASALRTALPHAVRVLDAFHVVALGSPRSTMSAAGSSTTPRAPRPPR